jgi:hypothetical protein
MDFKKHLEIAWNLTLKNLAMLILMTLVLLIVSTLTLGILAPVLKAGYFQSILMMVRNKRQPVMQDLFSQMNLFLPLFGFSILVFIAITVGFLLFVLPGIAVVCAIAFGCLYMLPLMTDQKLSLMDAIKKSWQMALQPNITDHIAVVIVFIGLISIGSSAALIGTLLTLPFATIFVLSVYVERMRESQTPAPVQSPD